MNDIPSLPGFDLKESPVTDPLRYSVEMVRPQVLRRHPFPIRVEGDTPDRVVSFILSTCTHAESWNQEVENLVVIMLNTRRVITSWAYISSGTLDTLLVHPREVFRPAIAMAASAIILAHNHPSGDPSPSEADIRVTRDLVRAGQILKIDVLDHLVVAGQSRLAAGTRPYVSLRELGYFAS